MNNSPPPGRGSRSPTPYASDTADTPGSSEGASGVQYHGQIVQPAEAQPTQGIRAPEHARSCDLNIVCLTRMSAAPLLAVVQETGLFPQSEQNSSAEPGESQVSTIDLEYARVLKNYGTYLAAGIRDGLSLEDALFFMQCADKELDWYFSGLQGKAFWNMDSQMKLKLMNDRYSSRAYFDSNLPFSRLYCDRLIALEGASLSALPANDLESQIITCALVNDEELINPVISRLYYMSDKSRMQDVLKVLAVEKDLKDIIQRLLMTFSEEEVLNIIPCEWLHSRDYYQLFNKVDQRSDTEFFTEMLLRVSQALSEHITLEPLCELYMEISQQFISRWYQYRTNTMMPAPRFRAYSLLERLFGRIYEMAYEEHKRASNDDMFASDQPERAQTLAAAYVLKNYILGRSAYLTPERRAEEFSKRKYIVRQMLETVKKVPRYAVDFDASPWEELPRYLKVQIAFYACLCGFRGVLNCEHQTTLHRCGGFIQNAQYKLVTKLDNLSLPLNSAGKLWPDIFVKRHNVKVEMAGGGVCSLFLPGQELIVFTELAELNDDDSPINKKLEKIFIDWDTEREVPQILFFPGPDDSCKILQDIASRISIYANQAHDCRVTVLDCANMKLHTVPLKDYVESSDLKHLPQLNKERYKQCNVYFSVSRMSAVFVTGENSKEVKCSAELVPLFEPQRLKGASYLHLTPELEHVVCSALLEAFRMFEIDGREEQSESPELSAMLQMANVRNIRDILKMVPMSVRLSIQGGRIWADQLNDILWCVRELTECFKCPISCTFAGAGEEWVYDADGFPFDKPSLSQWLTSQNFNPRSREPMVYANAQQKAFLESIMEVLLFLNKLAPLEDLEHRQQLQAPVSDEQINQLCMIQRVAKRARSPEPYDPAGENCSSPSPRRPRLESEAWELREEVGFQSSTDDDDYNDDDIVSEHGSFDGD